RGSDRAPDRAHQQPHRALQAAREGPPLAPGPPDAHREAAEPPRVPPTQGRRAVPGRHREARNPSLTGSPITDRSSDGRGPGARERAAALPAPHGVRRIPADTRGHTLVWLTP